MRWIIKRRRTTRKIIKKAKKADEKFAEIMKELEQSRGDLKKIIADIETTTKNKWTPPKKTD